MILYGRPGIGKTSIALAIISDNASVTNESNVFLNSYSATVINAVNIMRNYLSSKGKLTKLINFNDTILAFQDKGISVVSFNNRTALSTESGVPIEILNSNKVEGYRVFSSTSGCTDNNLICIGSSGLYYLDVYNSSLYRFNSEGLDCISDKGMSVWFKANAKNIRFMIVIC